MIVLVTVQCLPGVNGAANPANGRRMIIIVDDDAADGKYNNKISLYCK